MKVQHKDAFMVQIQYSISVVHKSVHGAPPRQLSRNLSVTEKQVIKKK